MPAAHTLTIAVTDKNPHVREFLCRELADLGHGVSPLSGARELLEHLSGPTPSQVLVLDPEAVGSRLPEVAKGLRRIGGKVIVVLHVFPDSDPEPDFEGTLVVEKQPHIGSLKTTLASLAKQIHQRHEAEVASGRCETQEQA